MEKCGNLIGVSPPRLSSFLAVTVSRVLLAFGGRQDDEHPAQGTSASSKMPIAPPLRNIEKGMELEASVLTEGKERGLEAGTPLQRKGG